MITVRTTNFGKALLVMALHNDSAINFLTMKFGNGEAPRDPNAYLEMDDLVNPLLECNIVEMTKGDNYIQLTCIFDNDSVENDFDMTEIGVFAQNSVVGKGMFAWVSQEDDPEPVCGINNNKLKENHVSVQIIVDDAENVTASVKSLSWATKGELEDHIYNYNNPHRVTKEQVGLGNVENVATKDAVIVFPNPEKLENIDKKDKLSDILGKIWAAIKALMAHIADKNNPHGVTALGIEAAGKDHKHNASHITSGTLSVGRGGTGKSSWTKYGIVYSSDSTVLNQIEVPGEEAFLMQDKGKAPYFKTFSSLQFCSVGTAAPASKNMLWIDTTPVTGGLKYHNGTSWVHVPVAYAD